jgi:hypothetical protein
MQRHIELVGLLLTMAGALSLVMAVSLFLLGAGALSLGQAPGEEVAASLVALLFGVSGAAAVVLGVTSIVTGVGIRRRRPRARLLALAVAVVNLCVLPFGTALGIYALWVLLHDQARAAFQPVADAGIPRP